MSPEQPQEPGKDPNVLHTPPASYLIEYGRLPHEQLAYCGSGEAGSFQVGVDLSGSIGNSEGVWEPEPLLFDTSSELVIEGEGNSNSNSDWAALGLDETFFQTHQNSFFQQQQQQQQQSDQSLRMTPAQMFEFGDPSHSHSDSIVHPRPRPQFNSPMLIPFGQHSSPLFQPLPHRSFSPHPYAPAVPSPLQTERFTPHHPHNRVTPLSLNMALQPPQAYPTLSNTPTHQLHMQNPFPSPVFNTYRDNLLESPALSAYSPSLAPGNSSTPMTGPNVFGNDTTIMTPFSSFQNSGGYAPDNGYWDASGPFNSLRLSEGSASSNCSTSSLTPPTIPSMPVVALSKNAIRVTPSKLFNRKPTVGRKPSLTNKSEEHRRMRKEAEKMRRDAMRDCVEELRSIIPPIAHMSDRFAPKEKVLEKALDFIGALQNEHAQKKEMISELELEIAQTKKLLYGA